MRVLNDCSIEKKNIFTDMYMYKKRIIDFYCNPLLFDGIPLNNFDHNVKRDTYMILRNVSLVKSDDSSVTDRILKYTSGRYEYNLIKSTYYFRVDLTNVIGFDIRDKYRFMSNRQTLQNIMLVCTHASSTTIPLSFSDCIARLYDLEMGLYDQDYQKSLQQNSDERYYETGFSTNNIGEHFKSDVELISQTPDPRYYSIREIETRELTLAPIISNHFCSTSFNDNDFVYSLAELLDANTLLFFNPNDAPDFKSYSSKFNGSMFNVNNDPFLKNDFLDHNLDLDNECASKLDYIHREDEVNRINSELLESAANNEYTNVLLEYDSRLRNTKDGPIGVGTLDEKLIKSYTVASDTPYAKIIASLKADEQNSFVIKPLKDAISIINRQAKDLEERYGPVNMKFYLTPKHNLIQTEFKDYNHDVIKMSHHNGINTHVKLVNSSSQTNYSYPDR